MNPYHRCSCGQFTRHHNFCLSCLLRFRQRSIKPAVSDSLEQYSEDYQKKCLDRALEDMEKSESIEQQDPERFDGMS